MPARASPTLRRFINCSFASIPASDGSLCGSARTILYTNLIIISNLNHRPGDTLFFTCCILNLIRPQMTTGGIAAVLSTSLIRPQMTKGGIAAVLSTSLIRPQMTKGGFAAVLSTSLIRPQMTKGGFAAVLFTSSIRPKKIKGRISAVQSKLYP